MRFARPCLASLWLACPWLAVFCGCEDVQYLSTFTPTSIEVVSVVPGRYVEGTGVVRACEVDNSADVDSVLISMNVVGSGEFSEPGGSRDNDRSVRPGDIVRRSDYSRVVVQAADSAGTGMAPGLFAREDLEFEFDCMSPHPLAAYEDACSVGVADSGSPDWLEYSSYFGNGVMRPAPDETGLAVAVLIDQSGSMNGLVEMETLKEFSPMATSPTGGKASVPIYGSGDRATDYRAFRLAAVQSLVSQLNSGDAFGIFQFGEDVSSDGARILCSYGAEDEVTSRELCFGLDREVLGSAELTSLQSSARGRTPLWAAVKDVYDYLKAKGTVTVRHILVITDGPDTCAAQSPDFMPTFRYFRKALGKYEQGIQSSACSDTSYREFLEYIHDDVYNQDGTPRAVASVPVSVSFIQIQSRGYPDVDPAQQQVACLTGGHYMFINANGLPPSKDDSGVNQDLWYGQHPLQVALHTAVTRFRGSIAGTWKVGIRLAALGGLYSRLSERAGDRPGGADGGGDGRVFSRAGDVLDKTPRNMSSTCRGADDWTGAPFGGAAIALSGSLSVSDRNPGVSPLDQSIVSPALMRVVDTIDFRGYMHLPGTGSGADCYEWMPMCSIAEGFSVQRYDESGNGYWDAAKDAECIMTVFDDVSDVCRVGDIMYGASCSAGTCCLGRCMPPPTSECAKNELDEVCNYKTLANGTPCNNGTCQNGKCVVGG